MSKVSAVDFGNVVLIEVRSSVTANSQTASEAISYYSSVFRKPAYLVSKESSSRVRYRGSNQNILRQLQNTDPRMLRWATYSIS